MRVRLAMAILVVLAVVLGAAGGVAAKHHLPGEGAAMQNATPVSGVLVGKGAGAYWYLAVDYPGADRQITCETNFSPADPVSRTGSGFNVHGPSGGTLVASGEVVDEATPSS